MTKTKTSTTRFTKRLRPADPTSPTNLQSPPLSPAPPEAKSIESDTDERFIKSKKKSDHIKNEEKISKNVDLEKDQQKQHTIKKLHPLWQKISKQGERIIIEEMEKQHQISDSEYPKDFPLTE